MPKNHEFQNIHKNVTARNLPLRNFLFTEAL